MGETTMRRKYRTPPIADVTCEFRFPSDSQWDMAVPGLLSQLLAKEFPIRDNVVSFSVLQTPESDMRLAQSPPMLRLSSADKLRSVTIGPQVLSAHHVPPYGGWESFKPLPLGLLEAYMNVTKVTGIQRIGLRYLNEIQLPLEPETTEAELETYFDFYPGGSLGRRLYISFIAGLQFEYSDARDILRVQLSSSNSLVPTFLSVKLDLDYFLAQSGAVGIDAAGGWLEEAHTRLEEVFESCIKEPLRSRFGPETKG